MIFLLQLSNINVTICHQINIVGGSYMFKALKNKLSRTSADTRLDRALIMFSVCLKLLIVYSTNLVTIIFQRSVVLIGGRINKGKQDMIDNSLIHLSIFDLS